MKKLLTFISLSAALTACKASNPALTAPPPDLPAAIERGTVEQVGEFTHVKYTPKVDIVFVDDDSWSMDQHHKKIRDNMKSFAEKLAEFKSLDFHIGYTFSYDSSRYGTWVQQSCPGTDEPNFLPMGFLQPLRGEGAPQGRRYVTREDDFVAVLTKTFDPEQNKTLIKPLINFETQDTEIDQRTCRWDPVRDVCGCGYGPQEEEMFGPALAVLSTDASDPNHPNHGFIREDSLKVFILVSDAKSADVSFPVNALTPNVVLRQLQEMTQQNRSSRRTFRVLAVTMKPGDQLTKPGGGCHPDPAYYTHLADGSSEFQERRVGPNENPLAELAMLTRDTTSVDPVLSICSDDYGTKLLDFAEQITKDVMTDIRIVLPSIPQQFRPASNPKNIRVFIGTEELDRKTQWTYSSQVGNGLGAVVTIKGQQLDPEKYTGQEIRIEYVPADASESTTEVFR